VLNSQGIIDVEGIASMSFAIIDKITYKDPNDTTNKPLNTEDKQILKFLFIIYTHCLSEDNVLPED
jgi:hypothetical protein